MTGPGLFSSFFFPGIGNVDARSFEGDHVPACFYRLGVGFAGQEDRLLHNPYFDVDENALKLSVGMMSWLAVKA